MKRPLVWLVGLTVAGMIGFPFLRSTPPEAPAADRIYEFAHRIQLVDPPTQALQPAVLLDEVERIASRLTWGSPEIVAFTLRHLPVDAEIRRRLARRIEELVRSYAGAPLSARPLVEALGALGDPDSIPLLLDHAQSGPDYLQSVAIRALSEFPAVDAVGDVLARLTNSSNRLIAAEAKWAILRSEGSWTAAALSGYLINVDGMAVNPALEEVARRGLTEAADAVARHVDAQLPNTRLIAIRTLLRLGDPRGLAAGARILDESAAGSLYEGLTLFRDAGVLPPLAIAQRLASHPSAQVRQGLADALAPVAGTPEEVENGVVDVLRRMADDEDLAVRRTAVAQLFNRDVHVGVQQYREQLRERRGMALREAVQFLCEGLQDARSAEIIRERLAAETVAADQVNLLFGLRFVGDARDISRYVQRIEAAGTPRDLRGEGQVYLSEYAKLYVQHFRQAAIPELLASLQRVETSAAQCLLLDAIRGVGEFAGREVQDVVLGLIADPGLDVRVRLAAVDSLPFLEDSLLGPRILELKDEVANRAVAQRLLRIFASFY